MTSANRFGGEVVDSGPHLGVAHEWLAHLPEDQRADFAKYITSCTPLLGALQAILEKKLEASNRSAETDYDSPGWPYRQADKVGYERLAQELLRLIP